MFVTNGKQLSRDGMQSCLFLSYNTRTFFVLKSYYFDTVYLTCSSKKNTQMMAMVILYTPSKKDYLDGAY